VGVTLALGLLFVLLMALGAGAGPATSAMAHLNFLDKLFTAGNARAFANRRPECGGETSALESLGSGC